MSQSPPAAFVDALGKLCAEHGYHVLRFEIEAVLRSTPHTRVKFSAEVNP